MELKGATINSIYKIIVFQDGADNSLTGAGVVFVASREKDCHISWGTNSISRYHLTSIGKSIVEKRRYHDRLISTMGFPILVIQHFILNQGPDCELSDRSPLMYLLELPSKPPTLGSLNLKISHRSIFLLKIGVAPNPPKTKHLCYGT